jgi:GT2 family glycosyltransferase
MTPTRATVCIATCNRTALLLSLLESLRRCDVPKDVDLGVVVVDNAPEPTVDAGSAERAWGSPLKVVHEARRGIPYARNRSVREAPASDLFVFVDDDEVVDEAWLLAHLSALQRFSADVTTGPVIPDLPADAPTWARTSRVFERRRHGTGTERPTAATNNTVVRAEIFDSVRPWFDERLQFSGGSDTEFFTRVHEAGYRIIWVDDAIVSETVLSNRLNIGWVVRRNYRVGTGIAQRWEAREPGRLVLRTGRQAARAVGFGFATLVMLPFDRGRAVRFLAGCAQALGRIAGHLGRTFDEYSPERIDGHGPTGSC